jgi:hypothetical protein
VQCTLSLHAVWRNSVLRLSRVRAVAVVFMLFCVGVSGRVCCVVDPWGEFVFVSGLERNLLQQLCFCFDFIFRRSVLYLYFVS